MNYGNYGVYQLVYDQALGALVPVVSASRKNARQSAQYFKRSGVDRRKNVGKRYHGVERRSGLDRRIIAKLVSVSLWGSLVFGLPTTGAAQVVPKPLRHGAYGVSASLPMLKNKNRQPGRFANMWRQMSRQLHQNNSQNRPDQYRVDRKAHKVFHFEVPVFDKVVHNVDNDVSNVSINDADNIINNKENNPNLIRNTGEAVMHEPLPISAEANSVVAQPEAAKPDVAKPDVAKPESAKPDMVTQPNTSSMTEQQHDALQPEGHPLADSQPLNVVNVSADQIRNNSYSGNIIDQVNRFQPFITASHNYAPPPADYAEANNTEADKAQSDTPSEQNASQLAAKQQQPMPEPVPELLTVAATDITESAIKDSAIKESPIVESISGESTTRESVGGESAKSESTSSESTTRKLAIGGRIQPGRAYSGNVLNLIVPPAVRARSVGPQYNAPFAARVGVDGQPASDDFVKMDRPLDHNQGVGRVAANEIEFVITARHTPISMVAFKSAQDFSAVTGPPDAAEQYSPRIGFAQFEGEAVVEGEDATVKDDDYIAAPEQGLQATPPEISETSKASEMSEPESTDMSGPETTEISEIETFESSKSDEISEPESHQISGYDELSEPESSEISEPESSQISESNELSAADDSAQLEAGVAVPLVNVGEVAHPSRAMESLDVSEESLAAMEAESLEALALADQVLARAIGFAHFDNPEMTHSIAVPALAAAEPIKTNDTKSRDRQAEVGTVQETISIPLAHPQSADAQSANQSANHTAKVSFVNFVGGQGGIGAQSDGKHVVSTSKTRISGVSFKPDAAESNFKMVKIDRAGNIAPFSELDSESAIGAARLSQSQQTAGEATQLNDLATISFSDLLSPGSDAGDTAAERELKKIASAPWSLDEYAAKSAAARDAWEKFEFRHQDTSDTPRKDPVTFSADSNAAEIDRLLSSKSYRSADMNGAARHDSPAAQGGFGNGNRQFKTMEATYGPAGPAGSAEQVGKGRPVGNLFSSLMSLFKKSLQGLQVEEHAPTDVIPSVRKPKSSLRQQLNSVATAMPSQDMLPLENKIFTVNVSSAGVLSFLCHAGVFAVIDSHDISVDVILTGDRESFRKLVHGQTSLQQLVASKAFAYSGEKRLQDKMALLLERVNWRDSEEILQLVNEF